MVRLGQRRRAGGRPRDHRIIKPGWSCTPMSDDELPPPFDESRWQEYVRERLPVGGWCESNYPDLVDLEVGLRYRIRIAPTIRLRRFSDSCEILVGAKLSLKTWNNDAESQCLLNHDEMRAIIDLYGTARECQHFSSVMPIQASLGTRNGLTIRSTILLNQPVIQIVLPDQRDAMLAPKTYDEFVDGLRECLTFVHEHFGS